MHSTAKIKAGFDAASDLREERSSTKTYLTVASLRVTAAGVTVAVAPLASAQVEAGAGPSVTFIALLEAHGKTPQVRDKW